MRTLAVLAAIAFVAAWLLTGAPVLAEEKAPGQKKPQAAEAQPAKKPKQEDTRKNKGPGWPRPFKPTEEISADSIVPFPTDI